MLARVLSARDNVNCKADIAPALQNIPHPRDIPELPPLASALADAIGKNQPVCVVGDYDADGVTAAVLAVSALKKMGANATWIVPERPDGYGLNPQISERAAQQAQVLLTVDNGASAKAGIARARELGMTVCVTDHHLPPKNPDQTPSYHFAANPQSAPKPWPAPNLAGVGVAFYAMAALRAELIARKKLNSVPNLAEFLDLVAVGSIADCVPMDAVNRSLTAQGMARIRAGKCRPGLRAILQAAGKNRERINTRDISHVLAPRVNAAGRLNDAQSAVRCLLAENDGEAQHAANHLEKLNSQRVQLQKQSSEEAVAGIPRPPPNGIVVSNPNWHPGLIGIIAARLGDVFARPAIVFADEGGEKLKGSGRSTGGFNLHQALSQMREKRPDFAFEFGGHASAVGVKLNREDLPEFAALFADACAGIGKDGAEEELELDEPPAPAEITWRAAAQINMVAWGNSFPHPRFMGEFAVLSERVLRGGHLQMMLEADGLRFPAVRFFAEPSGARRVNAVYEVAMNLAGTGAQLVVERTL